VSGAMLLGIVDVVRTKVLDYVLAIQAANPQADEATPAGPAPIPSATLHQTFNTTIIGQANVGGQGLQSISGSNTSNVKISQSYRKGVKFVKSQVKKITWLLTNLTPLAHCLAIF